MDLKERVQRQHFLLVSWSERLFHALLEYHLTAEDMGCQVPALTQLEGSQTVPETVADYRRRVPGELLVGDNVPYGIILLNIGLAHLSAVAEEAPSRVQVPDVEDAQELAEHYSFGG